MRTLLYLLGSLMAFNDVPPHRKAPEVVAAADASRVAVNKQQIAHVAALTHILKNMFVESSVKNAAGPGFADSLAALVGGAPGLITEDTEGSDLGDYWPTTNHMAIAPKFFYGMAPRPKNEVRGTMAHEFGHILDLVTPGLREEFLKRNPAFPAKAAWSGTGNTGYTGEALADAFAHAVHGLIPDVGAGEAYNYPFSRDLINAKQQSLLDSLVQARQKLLPR